MQHYKNDMRFFWNNAHETFSHIKYNNWLGSEKKLKQVSLEPTGYIKKDTNTFLSSDEIEEIEQGLEKLTQESFQSTSVETTTGGGFTTTYKDGTVVRTAEDGTETVISGPTA